MYFNAKPDELAEFFEMEGSLFLFGQMLGMLKPAVRREAVRHASRLILRIGARIADTGYKATTIRDVKGDPCGELNLDRTIEAFLDEPLHQTAEQVVSTIRERQKRPFVLIVDHSYSMKGTKLLLMAITAATVALHQKENYAVVAFNSSASVLKRLGQAISPERLLDTIFSLDLNGETNIYQALQLALRQFNGSGEKAALLLTDGCWNRGGDPRPLAGQFDCLHVICFPPARPEAVEQIAWKGNGTFAFVRHETEVARAIVRCLG